MKHWIKTLGAVAVLVLTTSHLALAQQQERARGGASPEARQKAEERPEDTGATEGRRPKAGSPGEADAAEQGAAKGKADAPREGREKAASRAETGQSQRAAAMERQSAKFDEIHAKRMAKLQRLRDLAVENDRKDMIARVDGLISRELERHARHEGRATQRTAAAPDQRPGRK